MVLDMRPMLRGEIDRIDIGYAFVPRLPEGFQLLKEATVKGEVTDRAGYMHLTLSAEVPYESVCARCLEPVKDAFSVSLERTVAAESTLTPKQLEENVDEYAVVRDGMLDLDDLIGEEILLSVPMRVLCEPDCPGLCPKCGKVLRLGKCGCPEREPDPRWAVLKGYRGKEEPETEDGTDKA